MRPTENSLLRGAYRATHWYGTITSIIVCRRDARAGGIPVVAPQSSLSLGSVKAAAPAARPPPPEGRRMPRWSRPFSLGSLVGDSLAVLGRRKGAILGPSFLLSLGTIALLEMITEATLSRGLGDLVNVDAGLVGVSTFALIGFTFLVITLEVALLFLSSLVTGAITLLAVADHRSKEMRLATAVRKSGRRLPSLIGDEILTSLWTLAPLLIFVAFVGVVVVTQNWVLWHYAVVVLPISGALAILAFGAVSLAFAITMVDHEDAVRSVSISFDMTRSRRGILFGGLFLLGVLPLGAVFLLMYFVPLTVDFVFVLLVPILTWAGAVSTIVPAVAYDLARRPTGVGYR